MARAARLQASALAQIERIEGFDVNPGSERYRSMLQLGQARSRNQRFTATPESALGTSSHLPLQNQTLGTEVQFYSVRFVDAENAARLGGYGVTNLYAEHRLERNWTLLARINNVADRAYAPAQGYANAGRTLFVSFKWAPQY